jgi:hypothetical protein
VLEKVAAYRGFDILVGPCGDSALFWKVKRVGEELGTIWDRNPHAGARWAKDEIDKWHEAIEAGRRAIEAQLEMEEGVKRMCFNG